MINRSIILASQSPRRQELIQRLGWNLEIKVPEVDETIENINIPVEEIPEYLAKRKAEKVSEIIQETEKIILAADTLVILNNEILGKPTSSEEAFLFLKKLSGNTHQVITGVCMKNQSKCITFSASTNVEFKSLFDEEIQHYITNFQPFDKAGSYGIQDWIGLIGIKSIQGDFYNVMGLPIQMVYDKINEF